MEPQNPRVNATLAAGGFAFILMALISFGVLGYVTFHGIAPFPLEKEELTSVKILAYYGNHLIIFAMAIVTALLGVRLLRASGSAYIHVIPPDDYGVLEDAIKQGKVESIDQYVRLSSLSGFTGAFTKVGLTGLPLTTVALTVVFALLAMYDKTSYLDLTKLTLGAFIGSFVQKHVEAKAASTSPPPGGSGAGHAEAKQARPPLPV